MRNIAIEYPPDFCLESTAELKIHPETKRLWLVLLDLLAQFDGVCRKYKLKYSLVGGSLIGAFRHGGIIPWDDDIDVMMVRSEYEKLVQVAAKEFRHPYFFQTNSSDPDSARGHAQLRNSNTTGILKSEMSDGMCDWSFNQGIFLDIFPLDNIPDDPIERDGFYAEITKLKNIVACQREIKRAFRSGKIFRVFTSRMFLSVLKYCLFSVVLGKDTVASSYDRLERAVQRYGSINTECCASIMFKPLQYRQGIFHKADLESTHYVPFEFIEAQVADASEKILVEMFGDWRRHVVGGGMHGGMLIDTDRPYTDYLKKK